MWTLCEHQPLFRCWALPPSLYWSPPCLFIKGLNFLFKTFGSPPCLFIKGRMSTSSLGRLAVPLPTVGTLRWLNLLWWHFHEIQHFHQICNFHEIHHFHPICNLHHYRYIRCVAASTNQPGQMVTAFGLRAATWRWSHTAGVKERAIQKIEERIYLHLFAP